MELNKKVKNRRIVNGGLLIVLLGALIFAGYNFFLHHKLIQEKETVKFGLITDVHCFSKLNKDTNEWEVNWRCSRPMEEFSAQMNNSKFNPDFVVELGDFIDGRDRRGEEGFWRAKELYDRIKVEKYYVMGNHETTNFTKDRWQEIVGYSSPYYYFDKKDYRFIVLDGNNVEVPEGSGNIVDMSPTTPHSYRGMMDSKQLEWLENLLENSQEYKKVIFIHEPPLVQTVGKIKDDIFINPQPLQELFSNFGVLAVFSGHIEETCDVEIGGVRYFSLHGFHKRNELLGDESQYKDRGVFHQVTIDKNDIEVEMFFSEGEKEPYQSIKINQDTAVCNNGSLPPQD